MNTAAKMSSQKKIAHKLCLCCSVCDCFRNISLVLHVLSCSMVFPNIQYLTFDLKSKPSSTPIWNIMFKSICFRQQFQSLYVMLLSFPPTQPLYVVTVCGGVFTATDCSSAEVRKWNVENPEKGKHVWLHSLLCFSECWNGNPLTRPPRQWLFLERAQLGPHALFMRRIHIHLSTSGPPRLNRCGTNIPRSKIQL